MSTSIINMYVDVFEQFGVSVDYRSGWETRSNGATSAFEGSIVHHTGGYYSSGTSDLLTNGRADLSGPLCNFMGRPDGSIQVIAAGPANHAGASGGYGTWPLPVTRDFNRRVVGLELAYPGSEPMSEQQLYTARVYAIATKRIFGDVNRCKGHGETSVTGKWDPGWKLGQMVDMNWLRATALELEEQRGNEDMAQVSQEQWNDAYEKMTRLYEQHTGSRTIEGGFPGYKTFVPDSDFHATLLDFIRIMDARLLRVEDLLKAHVAKDV